MRTSGRTSSFAPASFSSSNPLLMFRRWLQDLLRLSCCIPETSLSENWMTRPPCFRLLSFFRNRRLETLVFYLPPYRVQELLLDICQLLASPRIHLHHFAQCILQRNAQEQTTPFRLKEDGRDGLERLHQAPFKLNAPRRLDEAALHNPPGKNEMRRPSPHHWETDAPGKCCQTKHPRDRSLVFFARTKIKSFHLEQCLPFRQSEASQQTRCLSCHPDTSGAQTPSDLRVEANRKPVGRSLVTFFRIEKTLRLAGLLRRSLRSTFSGISKFILSFLLTSLMELWGEIRQSPRP